MKSTGMVRRIDELGRIVIPKEMRRIFEINNGDSLEIYVDGQRIMLQKYEPGCVLCGQITATPIEIRGKDVCQRCSSDLAEKVFHG